MSDRQNDDFEQRARETLRRSELELEPERVQQLQQARREAVAAAERSLSDQSVRRLWWWLPTGAVAAVALVVGLMLNPGPEPVPVLDPLEMSAAQDMDLLTELEFVAWMLEQENSGSEDWVIHAG